MKKKMQKRKGVILPPNPELHQQLRLAGHKVVPDKKKQASKNACRLQKGW